MRLLINKKMMEHANRFRATEPEVELPDRDVYVREKIRRRYKKGNFQGDPVQVYLRDNPAALKQDRAIEIDWRKIKRIRQAVVKTKSKPEPRQRAVKHGVYSLPTAIGYLCASNKHVVPTRDYATIVPDEKQWAWKQSKFAVILVDTGRFLTEHRARKAAEKSAKQARRKGVTVQIFERQ